MILQNRNELTICSVITPPGQGAVSVIRLSGKRAIEIIKKSFVFSSEIEANRAYYGKILNNRKQVVDHVLVTCFFAPKSFTGEDCVEVSCHGSPVICNEILSCFIENGARAAERGEFSFRAFMNGKMDLVQAEAIQALIKSKSIRAKDLALEMLEGRISKYLSAIEERLVFSIANLEASIDFSEENLEVIKRDELSSILGSILDKIAFLINGYQRGKAVFEGFKVGFFGKPNVGKSSLLNALLLEERVIVSSKAGTTRDIVKEQIVLNDYLISVLDTAGFRDSHDEVESLGIQKSRRALAACDLVIYVVDLLDNDLDEEFKNLPLEKTVFIGNKFDLFLNELKLDKEAAKENLIQRVLSQLKGLDSNNLESEEMRAFKNGLSERILVLSAKDALNSEDSGKETWIDLKNFISKALETKKPDEDALLSQARHFDNLSIAYNSCKNALELLEAKASFEFITIELMEALNQVQDTLGKRFDDEVLDRIFKEFCLGK